MTHNTWSRGLGMIFFIKKLYKKGKFLNSFLIVVLGIIIYNAIILNIAFAQGCDEVLRPVENSQLKYKKRDNRCEGFYRSKISTGDIAVVGVIAGKLNYKMDKNEVIHISSPFVRNRSIKVRAVGIPLKTYYRMDAKLEAREILEWPIKDVIYLKKLQANKIGIFGWIGEDTPKKYVPVKAVANLSIAGKEEDFSIIFRSSKEIYSVQWRSVNIINGEKMKMGGWIDMFKSEYKSGEAINISVPNTNADEVLVEIAGRDIENGEWLKKTANVIVKQ